MSRAEVSAMSRAEVSIEVLRKRSPLAVRLAEAVSFAVVIDRALLRAARLELVPQADAGTEADLWFSSIVQSRTSDGIVLDRDVAEVVRRRMLPAEVETAWRLTSREHAWLSPSLKVEEEIAYLSVSAEAGAHDRMVQRIQSVIRAMLSGNRPGLAQWATRALAMFPTAVRDLPETRMLDAGTRLRLGHGVQTSAEKPLPEWMSLVAPSTLARTELQVELRERELVLSGSFEPGAVAGKRISVPDTNPLVLEVAWEADGRSHARQVTLRRAETVSLAVGDDVVRLRTIAGEQYVVREVAETTESLAAEAIDFSAEIARHQRCFGREEELARLLATTGRVIVTGEHGIGKTALLCELIRRLAPAPVFVHFFRTGEPRLESIEAAERSLAAQIAIRYRLGEAVLDLPLPQVLERLALSPRRPERLYLVIDDVQDARAEGYDQPQGPPLPILLLGVPDYVTVYATALTVPYDGFPATTIQLGPPELETLVAFTGDERMAYLGEGNFGKAEIQVALGNRRDPLEHVAAGLWRAAPELVDLLVVARRPLPHRITGDPPNELMPVLRQTDAGVEFLNRTLRDVISIYAGHVRVPILELVGRLRSALEDPAVLDYYTLYAPEHLLQAQAFDDAQQLVLDLTFMREVIRRHGVMVMREHLGRVERAPLPSTGAPSIVSPDRIRLALQAFEAHLDALVAQPDDLEAVLAAYFPGGTLHLPPGRLLTEKAERERRPLPPRRHAEPVTGCARVDENHVATWSSDGTLMLWPREERTLAPRVVRFDAPLTAYVQINDAIAVVGDALGFVHAVRMDNAEVVFNFAAHDGAVAGAVAAEGAPLAATWSGDGVIRLWSVYTSRGIFEDAGELVGHEDAVTGCAFAGGARELVSSSLDGTIRVWNIAGKRAVSVSRIGAAVTAMTVSSDGRWLVAVDEALRLRFQPVEADMGRRVMIEAPTRNPPSGIARSPDNQFLAAWSENGAIKYRQIPSLDAADWHPLTVHEFTPATTVHVVTCAFVGPDSELFVSWSDGLAALLDPTGTRLDTPTDGAVIRAVAGFRERFCTGDDRGRLVEWSTSSGSVVRDYSKPDGRVDAVFAGAVDLVSDGEETVWFAGSEQRITLAQPHAVVRGERGALWSPISGSVYSANLRTGELEMVTERPADLVSACAVGTSPSSAAVGHDDGTVLLFGSPIKVDDPSAPSRVTALAFVDEDRALVAGYADGELTVSREAGSDFIEKMAPRVVAIEVSDALKRFATVRVDGTVLIRSFDRLELIGGISGTIDPSVRCRFSRDGDTLIGAARDHTIRIWSASSGAELAVARGHRAAITGLAVGEGVIYSSSEDRTVRMWDGKTGEQLAVVYGYNAFRCIDANERTIVAGDDAGELWRFTRAAPALGEGSG